MNKVINMKQEFLSKNQQIVLDTIKNSNEPLKAYSILFDVALPLPQVQFQDF